MSTATLHRWVRLTARSSGLLFAAAHTASALNRSGRSRSAGPAARPLYLAFLVAFALHFAVVARYAVATGGRRLFPGGRDLDDVGGWRTVVGLDAAFGALALAGATVTAADPSERPHGIAGPAAAGLVAALFVATYLRLLPESRWFAVPATVIGAATAANLLAALRHDTTPRATDRGPAMSGRRGRPS